MAAIRKKLIEVSIPLEAINVASAREKSIRHGHPSTLHLWWARRPLAACRAVLFAQLVDDPSSWPDHFPTEEAQDTERKRLHKVIEKMVPWDASNNEVILDEARWEIARSVAWGLGEEPPPKDNGKAILNYLQTKAPPVYDPFSGGGSIPLEAQRLGLRAYGSDLNPVAVLIGKALVEIPPKFAGRPPVNPQAQAELKRGGHWSGKGAQGLADDVRYYGQWMRDEAERRIGYLYPKAKLPDGSEATIIAWLHARTLNCPNPACGKIMPLISSFVLSSKKGHEQYIVPDTSGKTVRFEISNKPDPQFGDPAKGLKRGISGAFECIYCRNAVNRDYTAAQGCGKKMGSIALALVVEAPRGRKYLPPDSAQIAESVPKVDITGLDVEFSPNPRDVWCRNFGLTTPADLFTPRQLVALTTFSDLVGEAREKVLAETCAAGFDDDIKQLHVGGIGAVAYADAVATYLAFAVSKASTRSSTLAIWEPGMGRLAGALGRQTLPVQWMFAETNPLAGAGGDIAGTAVSVAENLQNLGNAGPGQIRNLAAQNNSYFDTPIVVSTDPPYYDNIGYADLSDFFYVWLRRSLTDIWPELFRRLSTPKDDELVALPYRHENKDEAEKFFMKGMQQALAALHSAAREQEPLTIYYAFKQAEAAEDGITSAGWASFLQAAVDSELVIDGTWPIRSEATNALKAKVNALASSIVLVCRKRAADAGMITRTEFIRTLKREMPEAIADIRKAGVGPVDMQQSVIGPGMGVFTRYSKVLEDDDSAMNVKTALALINRVWEEIENELDAAFDAETQVALAWFATYGFDSKASGELITLANAKNVSLNALFSSGVFKDLHGKAGLTPRPDLPTGWSPSTDKTPTVWECVQHTARILKAEDGGGAAAARLVREMGSKAADARALAYRLYEICSNKGWQQEALVYNELAQEWPALEELAQNLDTGTEARRKAQTELF